MSMPAAWEDLRVLIVADDPLVRAGLATLLAGDAGCTVVAQLTGAADLLSECAVYAPDAILWDLGWDPLPAPPLARSGSLAGDMPPGDIFDTLADLREAELPLLVLLPAETHSADVWAAGVRGLLWREAEIETILTALQAVARGLVILDPAFSDVLVLAKDVSPPALVEGLTPRELEVLQLLAEGLPNKTIAQRLDISDHTVKFHVNAIMSKLAAQSRTEAVVRATRLGLILL